MASPIRLLNPRTASHAVRRIEHRLATSQTALQCRQRHLHRPASASPPLSHPFHTLPPLRRRAHNKEQIPDQPPTTDFDRMDILGDTPPPATVIDACNPDGFELGGGMVTITGGSGALLVGGEAFGWRPWDEENKKLVNAKGQWEVGRLEDAFGLLSVVWPRPDLLILGLGPEMRPISPAVRKHISSLGIRIEVLDTRNAASQYNLLATERGIDQVAAALIPLGWKEGKGAPTSS